MIRVIYANGSYDMVKGPMLDRMIAQGDIAGFERTDGWVVVGRDRIRQRERQELGGYQGPERRGVTHENPFVRW